MAFCLLSFYIMKIELLQKSDYNKWDTYVMQSDYSVLYHLTIWKDIIEQTFGHSTYYFYAIEAERIKGILPLVHIKSLLFGNFFVSLPFFNYGGLCTDKDQIAHSLLEEAINVARDRKADYIEFRHVHNFFPEETRLKTKKVSMRLTLPSNPEDLWKSFSSKLRAQIRRPLKEKMYHYILTEDGIDYFYEVFSENMRDLGTPVYPKKFFQNIFRYYRQAWVCVVFNASHRPVAAGILLGFKDTIEIPWASSLRRFNKYASNMLLYWACLEFACRSGYKFFDFGRSTYGSSTFKFKEQWGAVPHQLFWHYWINDGERLPELSPDNPKYRLAIRIWKNLPLIITNNLGPKIIRFIP